MMEKVQLSQPIKRGEDEIVEITLREPCTGDIRGTKSTDLLQMDVAAITVVLTRISSPVLTPAEIDALPASDFVQLAGRVVGFLAPPEVRKGLA